MPVEWIGFCMFHNLTFWQEINIPQTRKAELRSFFWRLDLYRFHHLAQSNLISSSKKYCCCLAGGQGLSLSGTGQQWDWLGWGVGCLFSTGQNAVITLIALIQCWYSASRVVPSMLKLVSITIRCCRDMKPLCSQAPITLVSTSFPPSWHPRSITGCPFLYHSRFSQICQFCCCCFSLCSSQTALLYFCFVSIIWSWKSSSFSCRWWWCLERAPSSMRLKQLDCHIGTV